MVTKVTIPKPNANIEEVMLTAWLKKEGDMVEKREPIAELTTDKAVFELEASRSGMLCRILAPEKSTLPVGYIIALIGNPDDKLPDVSEINRKIMERYRSALRANKSRVSVQTRSESRVHVRATPSARRIATEAGIDLSDVTRKMNVEVITESVISSYLQKFPQYKKDKKCK